MNTVLLDRYEIHRELSRGAQGRTFAGVDLQSDSPVAIKELLLANAVDWKAVELFERESLVLRALEHPAIPRYIDAFHIPGHDQEDEGERYFLIQELIDGEDLKTRIDDGRLFTEQEAYSFLQELFPILSYLHDLSPPVIHRDIKPSNIIARPDGSFALVDFGGVQMTAAQTIGGSTVVGTTGYMAPEQLLGRAIPSSDLYSLAATTVHLLTGSAPHELTTRRMRLQFRHLKSISPGFVFFLERMLAPTSELRVESARAAADILASSPTPQGLTRAGLTGAGMERAGLTDAQLQQRPTVLEWLAKPQFPSVIIGLGASATVFGFLIHAFTEWMRMDDYFHILVGIPISITVVGALWYVWAYGR